MKQIGFHSSHEKHSRCFLPPVMFLRPQKFWLECSKCMIKGFQSLGNFMLVSIIASLDIVYIYMLKRWIQLELNNHVSQLEETNGKGKDPTDSYIVFSQPPSSGTGTITFAFPDPTKREHTLPLAPWLQATLKGTFSFPIK